MENLLWIGSMMPEEHYRKLCENGYSNQQASRISQSNTINGLEQYYGCFFDYISGPALPAYPRFKPLKINEYRWEDGNGSKGICVGYLNIEFINRLFKMFAIKYAVNKVVSSYDQYMPLTVYVNSPHSPFMVGGLEAKKINKNAKLILMIPDLPQYMEMKCGTVKRILKNIDYKLIERNVKKFDYYVLYTRKMKDVLHLDENKCIVMEGSIDPSKTQIKPIKKSDDGVFRFMYSGKTDMRFGLKLLIDAFERFGYSNCKLIITGDGDAVDYIKKAATNDCRIDYKGFVSDYSKVKALQQQADILLSMRLPSEAASKYCFPSKIFEYMLTGNPVMSFKIGGIPDEYYDYMLPIESEDIEGVLKALYAAKTMGKIALATLGERAQQFVLQEKTVDVQMKKIYDLVECGIKQ